MLEPDGRAPLLVLAGVVSAITFVRIFAGIHIRSYHGNHVLFTPQ